MEKKFSLPVAPQASISPILLPYLEKTHGLIVHGSYRLQKLLTPCLLQGILNFPSILVTGSNGKGTTCAYLEKALRDHSFKTGLYTSPHLVHPTERVRVNGSPVSETQLEKALSSIQEQALKYLPDASFFEMITAAAFLIFLEEKIDFLVCEVGLGGHRDSTNALCPLVSVLTSVSLEHTSYLGSTCGQIAADKSHIARRNRPLVIGPLDKESLAGVDETIQKLGAFVVPQNTASLEKKWGTLNNNNCTVALTALKELSLCTGIEFEDAKIEHAMRTAFWPGRFDVRTLYARTVIFDAAHNSAGFEFFRKQYANSNYASQKCVVLFASLIDKDWESTLEQIPHLAEHIIFTQFPSPRCVKAENFLHKIKHLQEHNFPHITFEIIPNFEEALQKSFTSLPPLPLLITGSIAFIGNVMERLCIEVFPS